MTKENIAKCLQETKLFLDILKSKDKSKFKKMLGINHKQLNEMMAKGIDNIVLRVRDNLAMIAFIESKGLNDDMIQFYNDMVKEEGGKDGKSSI